MSTVHVGVISDTHGLLRPEALAALQGVSLILHAGDVGSGDIIPALEAIAPVQAVRGNVDHGAWVQAHPFTRVVEAGGARLYMLHDLAAIELDPAAAGFAAVISGHSHQPKVELRRGVL
jgi:putative phosphoesterase